MIPLAPNRPPCTQCLNLDCPGQLRMVGGERSGAGSPVPLPKNVFRQFCGVGNQIGRLIKSNTRLKSIVRCMDDPLKGLRNECYCNASCITPSSITPFVYNPPAFACKCDIKICFNSSVFAWCTPGQTFVHKSAIKFFRV